MDGPELRFAVGRSGARIAFQQWGAGVDLVSVPPLAQNIEASWGWPGIVRMFERFGRMGRFTHYDKRGTGASDRIRQPPELDERVEDMRTVLDAAGVERAWLLGNSDGGPTALLFALAHPERVHGVVLFGSGASTVPPIPDAEMPAVLERQRALARLWGTPESPWVDAFAPSLAADQELRDWHQRYQRLCCDSETLYDLIVMSLGTDVSEVLPRIDVPVVAIHRSGDRIVSVERAREAVELLPDARLVELPGEDHFGYAGDVDAWMDVLEEVVTGEVAAAPPRPVERRVVVRTLGRFVVEVDGEEVPTSAWGSRHARTIVKRLAVARGWPVTRDELFELLWPGETDRARVGARLSVQLSTVRRVLGGGVVADRETVRLDLDRVELDLALLDAARDDGAVVAAYTGTFLPCEPDAPWAVATRVEVRARFAAAAAALARDRLDHGLPVQAARVARLLVDDDPGDLRGHALLVEALLDAGRDEDAARAHDAWAAAGEALDVQVPPLDPA